MTKTKLPEHRARPLLVAAAEPIEERPTAHGLAVQMFPPAPGKCRACSRQVHRLTRKYHRCPPGRGCAT